MKGGGSSVKGAIKPAADPARPDADGGSTGSDDSATAPGSGDAGSVGYSPTEDEEALWQARLEATTRVEDKEDNSRS